MIEIEGYGLVAVERGDDAAAGFVAARHLTAVMAAAGSGDGVGDVRVIVEVRRRLGGIAPGALLGGRFVAGIGDMTRVEVAVAGFGVLGGDGRTACRSRLWKRPLVSGLPREFGDAVLDGLTEGTGSGLPAGTLVVDRAGFDETDSSETVFAQAATFLRLSIAAVLSVRDPEPLLRRAVETW